MTFAPKIPAPVPRRASNARSRKVSLMIASVLFANRREREKYECTVSGERFTVYPGVFSPKYCRDTAFYAERLPVKPGDSLLEIGCGTGVISVLVLRRGARRAVAVDINPVAVVNTLENARLHGVERRMSVRKGDVFEAVAETEKFDTVFWNLPFGYREKSDLSPEQLSVYDPEYAALGRFTRGARFHLTAGGRVFFGCSPELSDLDLISSMFSHEGFSIEESAGTTTDFLGDSISFVLFEARRSGGGIPEEVAQ